MKRGLSEILYIAQKFAVMQQTKIIVYELKQKFDFSDEIWFEAYQVQGAKKLHEIDKDGIIKNI